jgi:uncharacterized membrane protein
MSSPDYHLSEKEEQEVVKAIQMAEKETSGEIRVHIEKTTDKAPLERAKEVFFHLKMNETKAQNGVLFYLAAKDHTFVILGDQGVDSVVPDNFWNSTRDLVIAEFKKAAFAKGLIAGIEEAGKKLKEFFPYVPDDTNELSDEISKS